MVNRAHNAPLPTAPGRAGLAYIFSRNARMAHLIALCLVPLWLASCDSKRVVTFKSALYNRDVAAVQRFIEHDRQIVRTSFQDYGESPIHVVARMRFNAETEAIAGTLLAAGADVNAPDNCGLTPLMVVRDIAMLRLLLTGGPSQLNTEIALVWAIMSERLAIAEGDNPAVEHLKARQTLLRQALLPGKKSSALWSKAELRSAGRYDPELGMFSHWNRAFMVTRHHEKRLAWIGDNAVFLFDPELCLSEILPLGPPFGGKFGIGHDTPLGFGSVQVAPPDAVDTGWHDAVIYVPGKGCGLDIGLSAPVLPAEPVLLQEGQTVSLNGDVAVTARLIAPAKADEDARRDSHWGLIEGLRARLWPPEPGHILGGAGDETLMKGNIAP